MKVALAIPGEMMGTKFGGGGALTRSSRKWLQSEWGARSSPGKAWLSHTASHVSPGGPAGLSQMSQELGSSFGRILPASTGLERDAITPEVTQPVGTQLKQNQPQQPTGMMLICFRASG